MSAKCLVLTQSESAVSAAGLVFDSDQFHKATCLVRVSTEGVRGTMRVPMLQVVRSFNGSEILIIAVASILVVSITFLF